VILSWMNMVSWPRRAAWLRGRLDRTRGRLPTKPSTWNICKFS